MAATKVRSAGATRKEPKAVAARAKDSKVKAQIMGGLLLVVALGVFGLSCANVYPLVECSQAGAKELFGLLITALIANQSTFVLAVRPFQKAAA